VPQTSANLIWKIADLLRGPYQPNQYGDVILPFTILRRLDCILEPTKDDVLAEYKKIASTKVDPDVLLKAKFKRGTLMSPTLDYFHPVVREAGGKVNVLDRVL
jgi:type I restriction enzyme M protein